MNFQNATVGSIDFSPHACCKEITLILNESDLQSAFYSQIERFWSVYYSERAPSLKNVTLVLRPRLSTDYPAGPVFDGINRFLAYFHDNVRATPAKKLSIYIDTDTETQNGARNVLMDTPYLVLSTTSPSQTKAVPRPAILSGLC